MRPATSVIAYHDLLDLQQKVEDDPQGAITKFIEPAILGLVKEYVKTQQHGYWYISSGGQVFALEDGVDLRISYEIIVRS